MTVEGLRRRRPEPLAELLERHGRELQAVAYWILRDQAAAEDVVIETLLTAFEKGGSIRDEHALRAWLIRVATNEALRARNKAGRVIPLGTAPDLVSPGDMASAASNRVALLDGIAALPLQMRAAVILRYYADLSVEEVAATLAKSPNTIKAQLQTALDRLRIHFIDPADVAVAEAYHA